MEMPMDNAPKVLKLTELLMISPLPVYLDPRFTALIELTGMLEGAEARTEYLKGGVAADDPCPAMVEYLPAWIEIEEKISAVVKELNALATEKVKEITQLAEGFEFSRLKVIAACPKDGCPDRDTAQTELGWKDGAPVLQ